MSPEDMFLYPVMDLDIGWALYLNRLTINESKKYFAFRTNDVGKILIQNYEMNRLLYPPGKNDLSWVDFSSDWGRPLP